MEFSAIGFWLPAIAAVFCLPAFLKDETAIYTCLFCWAVLIPIASSPEAQSILAYGASLIGLTDTAVRIPAIFPVLYILLGGRNAMASVTGAFVAIITPDIVGALNQPWVHTAVIGGGHWLDGLLLQPLMAFASVWLLIQTDPKKIQPKA